MRVKLLSPVVAPAPQSSVGISTSMPGAAPASTPRPQPRLERALAAMTSWSVAVPGVLICGVVLGWSLVLRLPDNQRLLTARAREFKPIEQIEKPVSAEQLSRLRTQASQISASLPRLRGEIASLLFDLDARARKLGWRAEVSMNPVAGAPGGFKELTLHPVVIQLDDEADWSEPPYQRLLVWLRHISTLPKRVEVVACRLRSAGAGLVSAQVELNLFSLNSNEESAPK